MSQNNRFDFNVSKSGPTTSTTNTNTVSTASTNTSNDTCNNNDYENSGSKSPYLQNMLANIPLNDRSMTSFSSGGPILASGVAPTVLTVEEPANDSNTKIGRGRSDLIGLFDKFDIAERKSLDMDTEKSGEANKESVDDGKRSLASDKAEAESQEVDEEDEGEEIVNEKVDNEGIDILPNSKLERHVVEKNSAALMMMQPYIPPEDNEGSDETIERDESVSKDSATNTEDYSEFNALSEQSPKGSDDVPEDHRDHQESDIQKDPVEVEHSIANSPTDNIRQDGDGNHERIIPVRKNSRAVMSELIKPANSEEQHKQSHRPFDFQTFLVNLKRKSADPIVRYVRSFLVSFSKQGNSFTTEQKQKIIVDFKSFMNEKFLLYEPFASMDETDLENSREGLEKLIMNRLYEHCFAPEFSKLAGDHIPETFAKDISDDEKFTDQLEKFSWVNASHLDLDLTSETNDKSHSFIGTAITEINKINNYRAPRDKIICFLNCCKIIFSYLRSLSKETNADSFVPVLILVIIKAKTSHLISNIQYIKRFRSEEWLNHGEISYYLLSLEGAIAFIENLGFDELSIDEEEYNAHIEAWNATLKQKQQSLESTDALQQPLPRHAYTKGQDNAQSHSQSLSPSSVLMTSAEMFTKSLSSFLSSPNQDNQNSSSAPDPIIQNDQEAPRQPNAPSTNDMKQTYENLKEVFPTIDSAVIKDIIVMSNGDMDQCVDACLQLVNVV